MVNSMHAEPLSPSRGRQILALVVSLALCFGVAALGNLVTLSEIDSWYAGLSKPAWTAPNWVFGPVWTVLYLLMAIAAWRVWRKNPRQPVQRPLALFLIQLGMNCAWSFIFFGAHWIAYAAVEIVLLWCFILLTIIAFWRIDRPAALLLLPYLAWVSYASALNFALWQLNV